MQKQYEYLNKDMNFSMINNNFVYNFHIFFFDTYNFHI
jgi:hypothetical protein